MNDPALIEFRWLRQWSKIHQRMVLQCRINGGPWKTVPTVTARKAKAMGKVE